MIRAIVGTSLRFRLLVLGIAAAVMVVGITQLRSAPVDVLPEFSPPYVEIQTEALGLSAQEVEQFITVPLEADLLNGVQGVKVMRSESIPGLSSIVLVFEPGSDVYRGRQLVQERLTQTGAAAFPNVSKPPTMLQPLSSSSRVMMIGLSGAELTPIEKSVIARWTMRPRLMGVPGVANVSIWGFRDQQLQVQVDPKTLKEKNVSLSQVISTTGNAQVASPVTFLEASTPGTGGFIETPTQRLQVRNVLDKIADPKELGKVPVEGTGNKLRLSDVADVKVDHQPLIGDAVVNDAEGLLLVVEKFPGANTREVTTGVEGALDKLRPGLAGIETDSTVFRPATFIDDAIDNLRLTIIIAAVLLVLILAALLFQWRALLISVITIPVSLVAAALVLDAMGQTFNAISFAGLAVAIAVVIDEAVVSVDGIGRRLRQHREAGNGRSTADVVLEASREMRSPLAYATLIALLAIVPVAVMQGRPGAFFEPLAISYALAVGAAMIVALTLTPALAMMLFSKGSLGSAESPVIQRLLPRYRTGLSRFVGNSRVALGIAAVAALLVILAIPVLGTSVIPTFKDEDVLVRLDGEPGTSNPKMTQIATQVSRELREIPGVNNVGAHVGRAVTGDQIVDVNSSELWVSIDGDADYDATLASIEDTVERVPDVDRDVVTYSTQKIRDVGALQNDSNPATEDGLDALTGADEPLVVRMYGQELDVLEREAEKVKQIMAGVDGVVEPSVDEPVVQPTVEIEVDLDKAQAVGIKPGDVRRAEAVLLQGIQVGSVFEGQKVFDVVVQGVPETRQSVSNVKNLLIDKPGGGQVRLADVADVRVAESPISIEREAVSRRLDIEAKVSGRSLDDVAKDIENKLADTDFPLEYHAEVFKATTGGEAGTPTMVAFGLAALVAAFLLMQAVFRSWRVAAVAFLSLPVALIGGLIASLFDGGELSLGALIGFLALIGLAARQSVLLIKHMQNLAGTKGEAFGPALVQRGARERFGPIVTSTIAIALVMVPFVVAGGIAGLEVVHPMAVVILGGLVSTLLLSLFVVPALYLRFGGEGASAEVLDELAKTPAGAEPALAGAGPAGSVELENEA